MPLRRGVSVDSVANPKLAARLRPLLSVAVLLLLGSSVSPAPAAGPPMQPTSEPLEEIECPPRAIDAKTTRAASALSKFQFEPFAFVADEHSSSKLLISPVRTDVVSIVLDLEDLGGDRSRPPYFGTGQLELFDDGAEPDEVAGDNVFTGLVQLVTPTRYLLPGSGFPTGAHASGIFDVDLTFVLEDASQTSVTERVGSFSGQIQSRPTLTITEIPSGLVPGVFHTADVINIVDEGLLDPYPDRWAQRQAAANVIYQHFPDLYDWLIFFNIYNNSTSIAGTYQGVRNTVEGIGKVLADHGADWGSAAALRGAIHTFWGNAGVTTHEVVHTWAPFGFSLFGLVGNHWGPIASETEDPILNQPGTYRTFTDLGDGTFEGCSWGYPAREDPFYLEFYLMGLAPSSEIGSYPFVRNATFLSSTSPCVDQYGYADIYAGEALDVLDEPTILAGFGPRNPPYPDDNHFRAAAVVVSERPLEDVELAFVSMAFKDQAQRFIEAVVRRAAICYELFAPDAPHAVLTITKSGTGDGTIVSLPSGIRCGTSCTQMYGCNNRVTLTPLPEPGSVFTGWSGPADCLDGVVTVGADMTCTANFDVRPAVLLQAPARYAPHDPSDSDCGHCPTTTHIAAEDLVLTEAAVVDEIQIWGGYLTNQPMQDSFSLAIHADEGGLPASPPLHAESGIVPERLLLGSTLRYAVVDPSNPSIDEYRFTFHLSSPLLLPPGIYWIALSNDSSSADDAIDFLWEASGTDPDHGRYGHAVFTGAGMWTASPRDLAIFVPHVEGIVPTADLSVLKSNGRTEAPLGSPVTYSIVVSNAGPSAVVDAVVTDDLPGELSGCLWTCIGSGASCEAGPVLGNLVDSPSLPAGASATYTVTCTVGGTAGTTLSNTATISTPAGVTETDPTDNSATDTDIVVDALFADGFETGTVSRWSAASPSGPS